VLPFFSYLRDGKDLASLNAVPVVVINPEVECVVAHHPSMNPSQNTPVLPNMRRKVMRPSGAS